MSFHKMKAPGEKIVIQIDITNRCDLLKCSNCTRMLTHHDHRYDMSFENFKIAVDSLKDYPGVIGLFGGNPCVHPEFAKFAEYFEQAIPDKKRRGLWSNNLLGHGEIVHRVFGYFNLNVHTNKKHADYMRENVPEAKIWGEDKKSWHSPNLVAIKDIIKDQTKMWSMIEKCDVNLNWSGAITERDGNLRVYFCEIASSFDHMYNEDNGLPCTPGWWKKPIGDYQDQINRWCPSCGIPLKMKGHEDLDFKDDVSKTHLEKVQLTMKGKRLFKLHDSIGDGKTHEVTDYMHLRAKK